MSSDGTGLWRALASGVGDLEQLLTRAGQGITLAGALIALVVTLFVSRDMGFVLLCLTASAFGWYTLVDRLRRRRVAPGALRLLTGALEVLIPLATLLVAWFTQGPEYALGSWVPPQLWSVFLAASILRLDPRAPAAMGLAAAATYGLAWALVLRPTLRDHHLLLYRDEMQLVRVGSLLVTGLAGSAAVLGLRRVIARAATELRAEDLFGKYVLGGEIAAGGMGRVLHATYCPEGGFRRRVAVKLIHPHLAQDPAFIDRFRQEAEIGARLVHPNVVATLDFGKVRDTYFLAMEYVDGRPLSEIARERRAAGAPLPTRVVAALAVQVAAGLEYAHERATDDAGRPLRVVHRDLTPANVLLDRAGRVRILDFGVAKALGDTTRAHTAQLVGKPAYLAPEALRGQGSDPRADLWSLGVVIWELLANDRLFARDTEAASLFAVVDAPIPRPDDRRPDLHPGWQSLLDGLLARDPDQRAGSAAAVRAALEALEAAEGPPAPGELAALASPEHEAADLPLDATEELVG
jgi:serine/threonine protein kinase